MASILETQALRERLEAEEEDEEDSEAQSSSPEPADLEAHQEYRPLPSPPSQQASNVIQAIHSAKPDRLYTLLLEIVTTIPAARALAEERLLVALRQDATGSGSQRGVKRKAYEVCENCDEEFSVVEGNGKGECVYHEGSKEVDYDSGIWEDCDEDPRVLKDEGDYADGFRWDSCGEGVRAEGCVVSRHVAKNDDVVSKRSRVVLEGVSVNANGNVHGNGGQATAASFRGPGGRSVMD